MPSDGRERPGLTEGGVRGWGAGVGGWGKKLQKGGGLGEELLMVSCSGFYVNLKSVFPLFCFEKGVFGELIYRYR